MTEERQKVVLDDFKKYFEENPMDYSSYEIFAMEQILKMGRKIPTVEEVAKTILEGMETGRIQNLSFMDPKGEWDEWDKMYHQKEVIVEYCKRRYNMIPTVRDWENIMYYVGRGEEVGMNSFHPGYFLAIDRFLEKYPEYDEDDFGEHFIDTATYIYSTPPIGDNKYKIKDIHTGIVHKNEEACNEAIEKEMEEWRAKE